MNETFETGHIKLLHPQKGYGFISPDKGGRDVFMPRSLACDFFAGQRVKFTYVRGLRNPVATQVVALGRG
jgi:cold shock CspA family protein